MSGETETVNSDNSYEELITITKTEYDELKLEQLWLQCLDEAGVDNWQGFDYAKEIYYERQEVECDEPTAEF